MAGAAEKSTDIVCSPDFGAICFHRKTDIDMTYPTAHDSTVKPMVKSHRCESYTGGIIINHDSTIEIRPDSLFFDPILSLNETNTKQNQQENQNKRARLFHKESP